MSTIMPQSELLRRAVAHVNSAIKDHPEKSLHWHVEDAAMRFNLSPRDTESLLRLFEESCDSTKCATD
jgi:hypothetical protein